MKKIILFLGILLLTSVYAISYNFSPTSFNFSGDIVKQKICKSIMVNADGNIIKIEDNWASNPSQQWSTTNFKTSAKEHNIVMDYNDSQLNDGEIEFCITFNKPGEYRGILILTPIREIPQYSDGYSAVMIGRLGIWIEANVISNELIEYENPMPLSQEKVNENYNNYTEIIPNSKPINSDLNNNIFSKLTNWTRNFFCNSFGWFC